MDLDTFVSHLTPEERSIFDTLVASVVVSGLDASLRGDLARLITSVLARMGVSKRSLGPLIMAIGARHAPEAREADLLSPEQLVPQLPYPLAMAMQSLLADAQRRQSGAHLPQFPFQLTAAMGLLVRMTAVIAIQSYVQFANASDAAMNQRVVTAMRAPADGTWLEVAVILLKHLAKREDTPLASLAAKALRKRAGTQEATTVEDALRRLITYRNRLLHGEAVTDAETSKAYELLLAALQGFRFLTSYNLIASHQGKLWQLSGLLPQPHPEGIIQNAGELPKSAPCLLHRDGTEAPLSMAPLLVFRPGNENSPVAFDELFFLNAGVAERLDYIAYRYARHVGGRALGTYDAFRRFLQHLPAPTLPRDARIDFSDLATYHDRLFVGRKEVLNDIALFIEERPVPYGILKAQGGMGKTAILARLYSQYGSLDTDATPSRHRWVFHFCMSLEDRGNAVVALRSIIAQVCGQFGLSATTHLSNDFDTLREQFALLLEDTSVRLASGERLVIVVDALDESLGANQGQSLPSALPAQLPESVAILISYRVAADGSNALVERSLSHIPAASRQILSTANPLTGLTRKDVGAFLRLAATDLKIPSATVEAVCAAAQRGRGEGIDPFYLRFVSEGIARGRIQLLRPETVPTSLDEAFDDLWLELPTDRDYLVYRIVCALAVMQDYGDDVLFADLFSRTLPEGVDPLTPLEVASLRAQAGKLLVYHGDRYGLMHERLQHYLVGAPTDLKLPQPEPT